MNFIDLQAQYQQLKAEIDAGIESDHARRSLEIEGFTCDWVAAVGVRGIGRNELAVRNELVGHIVCEQAERPAVGLDADTQIERGFARVPDPDLHLLLRHGLHVARKAAAVGRAGQRGQGRLGAGRGGRGAPAA